VSFARAVRAAAFVAAAFVAAAVALAGTPASAFTGDASAPATPQAREVDLGVTFTPRFELPFESAPILGELQLHVAPDGLITGYYRPESDRSAIPLSGATHGTRTFFEIGLGSRSFSVDGTLAGTDVRPSYAGTAQIGRQSYGVAATPCRDDRGTLSILCQ